METKKLAEYRVDSFLKAIRPLLIDFFMHGFKHGAEGIEITDPYLDKFKEEINEKADA